MGTRVGRPRGLRINITVSSVLTTSPIPPPSQCSWVAHKRQGSTAKEDGLTEEVSPREQPRGRPPSAAHFASAISYPSVSSPQGSLASQIWALCPGMPSSSLLLAFSGPPVSLHISPRRPLFSPPFAPAPGGTFHLPPSWLPSAPSENRHSPGSLLWFYYSAHFPSLKEWTNMIAS